MGRTSPGGSLGFRGHQKEAGGEGSEAGPAGWGAHGRWWYLGTETAPAGLSKLAGLSQQHEPLLAL